MFFKTLIRLCDINGTSPNAVAKEVGISSGTVTGWKNGSQPRRSAVEKMAEYFGVPYEYMMGYTQNKTPLTPEDKERIRKRKYIENELMKMPDEELQLFFKMFFGKK